MNKRKHYEMTQEDLDILLTSCKPVWVAMIGDNMPLSKQENVNIAWKALGDKMGFDHLTTMPAHGKGQRCFTAIPKNDDDSSPTKRIIGESECVTGIMDKTTAELEKYPELLIGIDGKYNSPLDCINFLIGVNLGIKAVTHYGLCDLKDELIFLILVLLQKIEQKNPDLIH